MALAQASPQLVALPRRERRESPRLFSPRFATWLPLASVLAGIASLFYLTQTSEVATTGYSIQELQVEESRWELRNEQLSLELDKARSLASVEAEATNRLKMVRPKDVIYLQIQPSDATERSSPASRGEARSAPALKKPTTSPVQDLLAPVRNSIAGMLTPQSQQQRRSQEDIDPIP